MNYDNKKPQAKSKGDDNLFEREKTIKAHDQRIQNKYADFYIDEHSNSEDSNDFDEPDQMFVDKKRARSKSNTNKKRVPPKRKGSGISEGDFEQPMIKKPPPTKPGIIGGLLSNVFGGPKNPNLSKRHNSKTEKKISITKKAHGGHHQQHMSKK